MASRIQAINAYRPKIELGPRVETEEFSNYVSSRTGLNESEVREVLYECRDGTAFFNKQARPVHLIGMGTYSPGLKLNGEFTVNHRADIYVKKQLNLDGEFRGVIINREHIGMTSEELVALWNQEHPDDPIQ